MRLRLLSALSAVFAFSALSRCTVGPDFVRPEAPGGSQLVSGEDVVSTRTADGKAQRFDAKQAVPERWWRALGGDKLDEVVQAALERNPTLRGALANLRQSHQAVLAGEGVFYPRLDVGAGVTRERSNPPSIGVDIQPSIFSVFTLSSTISYALDVFGGERRAVEGLRAQEEASLHLADAAYLSLTGNIVNTIIARAAYQAELDANAEIANAERREATLTKAGVRAGTLAYAGLLSLEAQLSATESSLPPLAQKRSQADHLLAALSGRTPAEWKTPSLALSELTLPETLPKALPSELVRRRPDILAAEAQLHAASAKVGVATAALYPSFTLSGTFGLSGGEIGNLTGENAPFWNLGASALAPIFHGGTLSAEKQAAVEAFNSALASYRQTVLAGLQQTADALRALEHDADLLAAQKEGLTASREELSIVRAGYRSGTTGYIQLLAAQAQYAQVQSGYLQAVAQRLQDTVALYVALGGGYRITAEAAK
jgi:NodT family efflux transporter outer membrane factor (OMF) lipoprotein